MNRLCVYCGSNPGRRPAYGDAAESLGRALGERGIELVYGGASVGLMGTLADAALEVGGEVYGVIPEALMSRELAHGGLTELEVVESMHARKARMVELADGFVALPGGIGTIEELIEVLTWAQLGLHGAPCGVVNVAGYYDPLVAFLDRAHEEGFLNAAHREMLVVADDPETLFDEFEAYEPPRVKEYLSDPRET